MMQRKDLSVIDADILLDAPLFRGQEDVVRCYVYGLGSVGGAAIDPERIPSGNPNAFREWLDRRTERLARAAAIMDRAFADGLLLHQYTLIIAMLILEWDWPTAAAAAEMDDPELTAEALKKRVYRAYRRGLRFISEAM